MIQTKKTLIITSCSSQKLSHLAPAKNLYQGTLFKKVKKLADNNHFEFKIISSKYGLLSSNEIISPYDKTIKNERDIMKIRELVIPKLKDIQNNYDLIIIIMGKNYRKIIEPLFDKKYLIIHDSRGIGGLISLISKLLKIPRKNLLSKLRSYNIN